MTDELLEPQQQTDSINDVLKRAREKLALSIPDILNTPVQTQEQIQQKTQENQAQLEQALDDKRRAEMIGIIGNFGKTWAEAQTASKIGAPIKYSEPTDFSNLTNRPIEEFKARQLIQQDQQAREEKARELKLNELGKLGTLGKLQEQITESEYLDQPINEYTKTVLKKAIPESSKLDLDKMTNRELDRLGLGKIGTLANPERSIHTAYDEKTGKSVLVSISKTNPKDVQTVMTAGYANRPMLDAQGVPYIFQPGIGNLPSNYGQPGLAPPNIISQPIPPPFQTGIQQQAPIGQQVPVGQQPQPQEQKPLTPEEQILQRQLELRKQYETLTPNERKFYPKVQDVYNQRKKDMDETYQATNRLATMLDGIDTDPNAKIESSMLTQLARMAGDVGALSNQDLQRYQTNPAFWNDLEARLKKVTTGSQFTKLDKKELRQLQKIYTENYNKMLDIKRTDVANLYQQQFPQTFNVLEQLKGANPDIMKFKTQQQEQNPTKRDVQFVRFE